MEAKYRR